MGRHRIDYRHLLDQVIPREQLSAEVRRAVDLALESQISSVHELAARRAIDSLVARRVLRRLPASSAEDQRVEEYLNRETGDTLRIHWTTSRRSPVIRIPIPPDEEAGRVPLSVINHILAVDGELFRPEGHVPTSPGEIVRAAVATVTNLTGADYATFVPARTAPSATFEDVEEAATPEHEEVVRQYLPPGDRAVVYLPDLSRLDAAHRLAPAPDFASVAFASIRQPSGTHALDGYLEVWSRERDFLTEPALCALAVFADQLGTTFRKVEVLERLVFYDSLTGLFNRHFFNIQLDKEMARARRAGHSFALAIADLDDFKSINTRFGYYGGNDLLEQVARLLRNSIRPFDIAARWGGEEFALILTPPVGAEEAVTVCNRIREAVAAHPYTVSGLDLTTHSVTLSLSMGVSIFPTVAEEGKALWTAANAALQEAKRGGKNRVVEYSGAIRDLGASRPRRAP